MSVTVRPWRRRGWDVDIQWRAPDGKRRRERRVLKVTSRSAAQRWGEARERELLIYGSGKKPKGYPPSKSVRRGSSRAMRWRTGRSPAEIAHKQGILRTHVIPFLGRKKLDAATNEDIQRRKARLHDRSAKTVNNVLTVLNTMLKKAVEWAVLDRMPCVVRLLKVSQCRPYQS